MGRGKKPSGRALKVAKYVMKKGGYVSVSSIAKGTGIDRRGVYDAIYCIERGESYESYIKKIEGVELQIKVKSIGSRSIHQNGYDFFMKTMNKMVREHNEKPDQLLRN